MKNRSHCLHAVALAITCVALLAGNLAAASGHPNLILFYTDDQGWADTSVEMIAGREDSRSAFIKTPNLERLARGGMVFSHGYSPSPVCSPSRDSILYGMTPARLQHSILLGKANQSPDALTTPRAVKLAHPEYVTAHFGKWACSPRTPEEAGFDVSDGRTDNWHGDWRKINGQKAPLPRHDPKRIFSVTRNATRFMERQVAAGRPFYMRVSHYALHVGHDALHSTIEEYESAGLDGKSAVYAAMAQDLDTGLGAILDQLDALAIADRTYVLFTSDNGGDFQGRGNGPLRGGKATLWEGGIRVPTVVRGPGVPAGAHCTVPIVGWDFLPTFFDLAGGTAPLPRWLDGGSLRDLFEKGDVGAVMRPSESLVFYYPWYDSVPMSAIRWRGYKLVEHLNTNQSRLFDVMRDPGESVDLSTDMPELKMKLHAEMRDYLERVDAEAIGELRANRERQLNEWIARDLSAIQEFYARADVSPDSMRNRGEELAILQRRLSSNRAALNRVRLGKTLTAW